MSEEKRHIDDLFRSGLRGHKATPPPDLWEKVSDELAARKRRGIIFAALKIAAGMAVLLGLGGGLLYYFIQDTPGDNYLSPEKMVIIPMPEEEKAEAPGQPIFAVPSAEPAAAIPAPTPGRSGRIIDPGSDGTATRDPVRSFIAALKKTPAREVDQDTRGFSMGHIAPLGTGVLYASTKSAELVPDTGMPAISGAGRGEMTTDPDAGRNGRWQAGIITAPSYSYRSLSRKDGNVNKAGFNQAESGLFSFSGRIAVNYIVNDRLSFQSGIDILNMGQVTEGMQVLFGLSGTEGLRSGLIQTGFPESPPSFNNSLGPVHADGSRVYFAGQNDRISPSFTPYIRPVAEELNRFNESGRIIQELYYLHTPVLVRYNLINGNSTTLLFSAGVGVNFLTGNRVVFEQGGESVNIGRTTGIRNISLGGIAGLGLEQNISNGLSLIVEPRFSHFISSVIHARDYRHLPYSISVSWGIFRKF